MFTIGFDADDTLWHNESLFSLTQAKFRDLLAPYTEPQRHDDGWIDRQLYATETRNLTHFGYGIKGFTLSMIETAIELTEGRISSREIQTILDFGRTMLAAPVELLPGVAEVVAELAASYPLLLITKGDLFDQESKIARSGLVEHFRAVEIVHEKSTTTYATLLKQQGVAPADFLMVGNSVRSDVLPVLEIGGRAVHIPYTITWQHESAELPVAEDSCYHLTAITELPALVAEFNTHRHPV